MHDFLSSAWSFAVMSLTSCEMQRALLPPAGETAQLKFDQETEQMCDYKCGFHFMWGKTNFLQFVGEILDKK